MSRERERIHGLGEAPTEMLAVYRARDGVIADVGFFAV